MGQTLMTSTLNKAPSLLVINSGDPTRTLVERTAFVREMRKRFKELRRDVVKSIDQNDVFGLRNPGVLTPAPPGAFAFPTSVEKINGFMTWLRARESQTILEIIQRPDVFGVQQAGPWTNTYISTSYRKGLIRGRRELQRVGYGTPPEGVGGFGAVTLGPIHADRVALLYSRTFSELEGVTRAMDAKLSSSLAEGMANGHNPKRLSKDVAAIIDSSMRRGEMIARTEFIRAHHHANINEYEAFQVRGVRVTAEWKTAGDLRVCERCRRMESRSKSRPFTLTEIRPLIPLHPNCRCIALPLPPSEQARRRRQAQGMRRIPRRFLN